MATYFSCDIGEEVHCLIKIVSFHSCESLLSIKISSYEPSIQSIFNVPRDRSLILPGEGVEDIHEGV